MDHSAPLVENIFDLPMGMDVYVQTVSDILVSGQHIIEDFSAYLTLP